MTRRSAVGLAIVLTACARRVRLEFSGRAAIGERASIPLPDGFVSLSGKKVVQAEEPDDENVWVRVEAFSFGEDGRTLLGVAQLADVASQMTPAKLVEGLQEAYPAAAWPRIETGLWRKVGESAWEASFGKKGNEAGAWVVYDRERLLQVLVTGPAKVLGAEVGLALARQVAQGYECAVSHADLFGPVVKAVEERAARRRKNYRDLLAALEREELDYVPTPRVVIFNPRLAALFRYARFDRSGTPARFAIVGLLGERIGEKPLPLEELKQAFPLVELREVEWRETARFVAGEDLPLARQVVEQARWAEAEVVKAVGILDLRFAGEAVDFSVWLTQLERAGRWLEREGYVELKH